MFDRNSFRPQLERFGDRINPADNVWLGNTDSFTTANFWSDGVPTSDDTLVFRAPVAGSNNPPIPATPGSNTSVTFASLTPPPPYAPETKDTYAGVRIEGDYAGTLTFPFHITFVNYTQTSGATSTPGKNVTVTGTFAWTGGVVNSSTTAGELRLEGVPGGVIGTNASTLTSGSKIVLKKRTVTEPVPGSVGSSATVLGELALNNGAGIDVLEDCALSLGNLLPGSKAEVLSAAGTASVLVRGTVNSVGGKLIGLGVLVDGGQLAVMQGGLKVTGEASGSVYSVKMTSGTISIRNEETLEATEGVKMEDGELRTVGLNNADIIQSAHIKGALTVQGGAVKLGTGAFQKYTTLKVTEDVKLYDGVFYTHVDGNHDNRFDSIRSELTIDCTSTFKLDITAVNGVVDPDDTWWGVLYAEQGIVGVIPGVTDPNTWKTPRLSSDEKSLAVVKK